MIKHIKSMNVADNDQTHTQKLLNEKRIFF